MRPGRYILVLLAVAMLSGAGLYLGTWSAQVRACRTLDMSETSPDAYLAYCDNPRYASYEHEAYALGLEPGAVDAMRRADILFLGNSRLQFAFSTRATDAFFAARRLRYHLLGFGYGESSAFPLGLIRRWHLVPRMVVINADPFFQDVLSPAAYDLQRAGRAAWPDGLMKRAFGTVQPLLCRLGLCPETAPATWRDRRTGQWIWHGVLMPAATTLLPIGPDKQNPWNPADLPRWEAVARVFLAALDTPPACIVLTGVPTPQLDAERLAATLGARLGLPVIVPALEGLRSADLSHLDAASAERWSAAFLAAAGPLIDECLK